MRSELYDKEISLREKFSRHGLKVSDYFIDIKGKNPSPEGCFLASTGAFLSLFTSHYKRFEEKGCDDDTSMESALQKTSEELFSQCSIHLGGCLKHLSEEVDSNFSEYSNIVSKNSGYAISGQFPSSQKIKNSSSVFKSQSTELLSIQYQDIPEDTESWEAHFSKYYKLIKKHQELISLMSHLIDIHTKKINDLRGIQLRWAGIGIGVIALSLAACSFYMELG